MLTETTLVFRLEMETSKFKEPIYNNIIEMYNKGANRSSPFLRNTADKIRKTNFSIMLLCFESRTLKPPLPLPLPLALPVRLLSCRCRGDAGGDREAVEREVFRRLKPCIAAMVSGRDYTNVSILKQTKDLG